jgi:hypothetical protein
VQCGCHLFKSKVGIGTCIRDHDNFVKTKAVSMSSLLPVKEGEAYKISFNLLVEFSKMQINVVDYELTRATIYTSSPQVFDLMRLFSERVLLTCAPC